MMIANHLLTRILFILIILYSFTDCVHTLTIDDFYTDPNATEVERLTGADEGSLYLMSPIPMYNIKSFGNDPITHFIQSKGYWSMRSGRTLGKDMTIRILRSTVSSSRLSYGEVILQHSTNSTLLQRASHDVNVAGSICHFTPTHLIIQDNIDVRANQGDTGSTFQTVLATNGRYTYLIIQFAQVTPGAAAMGFKVYIKYKDGNKVPLPFSSDIDNAPRMSNVNVAGRYVIDINEVNCGKNDILSIACKALKMENEGTFPNVCTTSTN